MIIGDDVRKREGKTPGKQRSAGIGHKLKRRPEAPLRLIWF
jgi:hypothetical protein